MRHKSNNKTRPLFTLSLEMTRLVNKTRLLLVPGVNSDIYSIYTMYVQHTCNPVTHYTNTSHYNPASLTSSNDGRPSPHPNHNHYTKSRQSYSIETIYRTLLYTAATMDDLTLIPTRNTMSQNWCIERVWTSVPMNMRQA